LDKRKEQLKMEKGYCVKCKTSQEMKNEEQVTLKNGRSAVKGKCSSCGTNMFKITGNKK
jgi:RNase P subunit RPR2